MARRVGGAQNDLAQPWHRKQHPAIGSLGHHQPGVTQQKLAVHHHVDTLAGRHQGHGRPAAIALIGVAVFLAQLVHPYTGGVDDAARLDGDDRAGLRVLALQARHLAALEQQIGGAAIVHQQGAMGRRAARQRQCQACIVELPVPVLDATAQSLGPGVRQQMQSLPAVQDFGFPQARLAGQHVVSRQAQAVKRRLPPLVRWHHKSQRLRQVGRVVQQGGALVQRFAHQRDIALRQITDTAVDQLGGTRRGSLGEVVRLDQHHAETPHGRVQRHAQSGGAAAHDGHVVGLRINQPSHQVRAPRGQCAGIKCVSQ